MQPVRLVSGDGARYWNPLTGAWSRTADAAMPLPPAQHGPKRLKGRARQRWLAGTGYSE